MREDDRLFLERNFAWKECDSVEISALYPGLLAVGSQNATVARLEKSGHIIKKENMLHLTAKGREKIVAIAVRNELKAKKREDEVQKRKEEFLRLKRKGY